MTTTKQYWAIAIVGGTAASLLAAAILKIFKLMDSYTVLALLMAIGLGGCLWFLIMLKNDIKSMKIKSKIANNENTKNYKLHLDVWDEKLLSDNAITNSCSHEELRFIINHNE